MQWAICWSGNSHLHLLRQKSNCSSHIVTQFMDVVIGVIQFRTLLESLLSVIVTHSSVLLMSPDTPARVWLATNATDHINVVFCKFAYSLMSRVIASPNSVITAIVNSDAYHQSPLMDKWESMLLYTIDHRQNYPSICQCVMNDHVINQHRQHMASVPKLFSIFHVLFRLYCLYL